MLLFTSVHFNRFYIFSNKNIMISNTTLVINVEEETSKLKTYEPVLKEVKYLTNSLVRLKILAMLYEQPLNMKDINNTTGISYSSISSNMHDLEVEGYLYRESNRYFLSNSTELKISNVLELKDIIQILNKFFNILDKHIVDMIPEKSITELHLLEGANIIESDDFDVYKVYTYIADALTSADSVKCILPFYYEEFNEKLNDLCSENKSIDLMVSDLVFETFEENSKITELQSFSGDNNFLLIVTDQLMILGLFKQDGYFDQNRLLASHDEDAIIWANNMFKNFKNENINEN